MSFVLRLAAALVLIALGACSPPDADLERGESGIVKEVRGGGTLVLDSGLLVRLAGIEAPRRGDAMADESRAALEKLTLGRQAELRYGGRRRLADDSAIAHVIVRTEGGRRIWVQEEMLRQGLVRVHTRKENRARAAAMLKLENEARRAERGLWSAAVYAIRQAEDPAGIAGGAVDDASARDRPRFVIVEGRVRSVQSRGDRTYLGFGEDYRSDFTIAIDADDLALFTGSKTPEALRGAEVRVRGYVREAGGPLIRVDHPEQIERPAG